MCRIPIPDRSKSKESRKGFSYFYFGSPEVANKKVNISYLPMNSIEFTWEC